MKRSFLGVAALLTLLTISVTGCATTRARKADPAAQDPQRQIADLKFQLDSSRQALPESNFTSGNSGSKEIVRVSGVTPSEVQRALLRAGYDPGPIDGRPGKKTKSAIKAFQRKNGLTADGVVGDKTWSLLRAN